MNNLLAQHMMLDNVRVQPMVWPQAVKHAMLLESSFRCCYTTADHETGFSQFLLRCSIASSLLATITTALLAKHCSEH